MDLLAIFLLIVLNGIFSMSEIAVVTARKIRLQRRAEAGHTNAATALTLANDPGPFLSTVQVGITSIGILSGALGEAVLADDLITVLAPLPLIGAYSEIIALVLIVVVVTYLSVIIGELVPKRLALLNPEGIASSVARPMQMLSSLAAPVVHFLNLSSETVIKLIDAKPSAEPPITDDEIRVLMEEGRQAGVFEPSEPTLVANILRLDKQQVTAIMTPRMDILYLDLEYNEEENRSRIVTNPYSHLPVCRGGLDNVLGLLATKDVLARQLKGEPLDLTASLELPLYIPETVSPNQLLETFRKTHKQVALIVDEYGEVQGLVTLTDVMEAIVGDIPTTEQAEELEAVRREDGSWLLDGMLSLEKFTQILDLYDVPAEELGNVHTIGGFAMLHLGRVPNVTDHFEWRGLRFEVVDMDRNRVDKLLVTTLPPPSSQLGELD